MKNFGKFRCQLEVTSLARFAREDSIEHRKQVLEKNLQKLAPSFGKLLPRQRVVAEELITASFLGDGYRDNIKEIESILTIAEHHGLHIEVTVKVPPTLVLTSYEPAKHDPAS